MNEEQKHFTGTGTRRLGGSMIAGGGSFRCSEAHCSCGWTATANGQTYAESMQEIREHLKSVGVYTTQSEQTVYAHLTATSGDNIIEQIAARSGKSPGIVKRSLAKLVERGNVVAITHDDGTTVYTKTDKWFSWND